MGLLEAGASPARNPDFRLLWIGQTISSAGDAFASVAMPLLVLEATGSVAQMGFVTAIGCAGTIATSFGSGLIVDRVNRRRLMIACDVVRGVLYGALPLVWWRFGANVAVVYAVAGLASVAANVFTVAYVAAIADIVETESLGRANAILQASQALAYVVGPMMAGVVAGRLGAASALVVDAASFGVSAVTLVRLRLRQERDPESDPTASAAAPRGAFEGFAFLFRHPELRAVSAIMFVVALLSSAGLGAAVVDLFIFRLRIELASSERVVGACLGAAAFGGLAGALASPRVRRRYGFAATFLGGTSLQALGLLTAAAQGGPVGVTLGATFWAGGLTLRAVSAQSLRQTLAPNALLGRVTAAHWAIVFGAGTVGAVLVTQLAATFGASRALTVSGALLVIVSVVGAFTPVLRAGEARRPGPELS